MTYKSAIEFIAELRRANEGMTKPTDHELPLIIPLSDFSFSVGLQPYPDAKGGTSETGGLLVFGTTDQERLVYQHWFKRPIHPTHRGAYYGISNIPKYCMRREWFTGRVGVVARSVLITSYVSASKPGYLMNYYHIKPEPELLFENEADAVTHSMQWTPAP